MARWIPALATVGLVSLMLVPAPGLWGLLIGVGCSLAIALASLLWLLDRVAMRLALLWARRARRRRVHAGSGMIRKAGTEPPLAASPIPPRPSPVQTRAQAAALRREAGRLEPFRLR